MKIAGIILFFFFGSAVSQADTGNDTVPPVAEEYSIDSTAYDYFTDLGVAVDSCNYYLLYQRAYEWIGTPYRYGGKTRKGIDCSAFIKKLYLESYNWQLHGTSYLLHKQATPITDTRELQEGDLVFFKIRKDRVSHVGVYLRDGYFIHASVSKGVMINNLSETYYRKYYFQGGRMTAPVVPNIKMVLPTEEK